MVSVYEAKPVKILKGNWVMFCSWPNNNNNNNNNNKNKNRAEITFKLIMKCTVKPPWRNGLACWTSNSKVVGSSPTGGGVFLSNVFF